MTHRLTQPADDRRPHRWGIGWPAEPLGPERLRLCGILLLLLSVGVWMASDAAKPEPLEVVDLTPQQVPEALWSGKPTVAPQRPLPYPTDFARQGHPQARWAGNIPRDTNAITRTNYQQYEEQQFAQQQFETAERTPRLLPPNWSPVADETSLQTPTWQQRQQPYFGSPALGRHSATQYGQPPTQLAQASTDMLESPTDSTWPGDDSSENVDPRAPQDQQSSQQPSRLPQPTLSDSNGPRSNSINVERMQFNFRNAPWEMVLRGFAEKFGLSLQLFHVPQGNFDYFDERSYTETEALDILNGALLGRGALMIRNRNFLVVVAATEGIPTDLIPQVAPAEISSRGRYEYFSVVFPIAHGSPQQMVTELQGMASRVGKLMPLSSSNHLYVADLGINLRQIQSMLSLDGGELNQLVSHVVLLKNAPAVDVAKAVNEFLQGGSPSSAIAAGDPNGSVNLNRSGVSVAAEPSTNAWGVETLSTFRMMENDGFGVQKR